MEPNASFLGKCSVQKKTRKKGCLQDFLANGLRRSLGCTYPRCLYLSKRFAPFPPGFHFMMGGNITSVKLSRQSTHCTGIETAT